jgi:predicted nucleic acid-binding protein
LILYADSSALLSWLFAEPGGAEILPILKGADFVVTSDLTLVECERAFHRGRSLEQLSEEVFSELQDALDQAAAGWILLRLSDEILDRARSPFPQEPIRTLDALHLATVVYTAALFPDTALLTLDDRMRRCALALGLAVLPGRD